MWFFFRFITWEQRKAETLFITYAEKGYPELPVLSATQDKGMVFRDDTGKNIFHDKSNEIGYKRVQPGQFVIHLRSFQGGFAHSAILGITSPAYTIFGFKEGEKQSDLYWKYVFNSPEFIRRLETVTYGIRDGRSINYDEFLAMKFVIPKYEEQLEIAGYLSKVDNLITLHQRKQNDKFSLFKPKNYANFLANSWEQRKFSELANTRRGLTYNPTNIVENGVRVLRSSNIKEDVFTLSEDDVFVCANAVNIEYVHEHEILITAANGSTRLVGKHAIIIEILEKSAVHGGFMLIASAKLPFFLNASMSAPWYTKFINLFVAGGNGAIGNLNKNDLDGQNVYVPLEAEQARIGEFFKQLDNLITLHQRKDFSMRCGYDLFLKMVNTQKMANAWEQRKLGEVANIQKGQQLGKAEMSNNGAFYVLNGGMEPSGY